MGLPLYSCSKSASKYLEQWRKVIEDAVSVELPIYIFGTCWPCHSSSLFKKKYLRSTQTVASAFLIAKWPDIGHHNPELGDRVAEAVDPVA